jgi:hypothetical protein
VKSTSNHSRTLNPPAARIAKIRKKLQQQAAQKKLWAKQQQLGDFSAKLVRQQQSMTDFEAQLTPPQKEAVEKAVKARYQEVAALAQQADNPLQKYEVADLKKAIRQQVLYERFVPVREIYHFGDKFLNRYRTFGIILVILTMTI